MLDLCAGKVYLRPASHRAFARIVWQSISRRRAPIISGRVQDVSNADIQVAVAAYQASIRYGPAPIGEIEVISHDEVRIHDDPAPSNYTSMLRVKGKWQLGSVVLVHPSY